MIFERNKFAGARDEALNYHRLPRPGKIEVVPSKALELSVAYTPGVSYPCLEIKSNPEEVWEYTWRSNTIAIVTDGSRILGLGDIGPLAGLPVMEGKAFLFKLLGDVNAIPLCLQARDTSEIVETMTHLEPSFGGVNLEDIRHPRCFEVEEKLTKALSIPIFHDDQHGTAVAALAALHNALKVVDKNLAEVKILVSGAGAAGIAITQILLAAGATEITVMDSRGAIYQGREENMDPIKTEISEKTNPHGEKGGIRELIQGKDVFIGVSAPNILTPQMIKSMNRDAIVFAMANPVPEINPLEARRAGARVVGSGSSEYPNQINNVLVFPGIFRGLLDCRARGVNDQIKLAAARQIADLITRPTEDLVIPPALDLRVPPAVARSVVEAAQATRMARKRITSTSDYEEKVKERIKVSRDRWNEIWKSPHSTEARKTP